MRRMGVGEGGSEPVRRESASNRSLSSRPPSSHSSINSSKALISAMVISHQAGSPRDRSFEDGLDLSKIILNISLREKRLISLINSNWSTLCVGQKVKPNLRTDICSAERVWEDKLITSKLSSSLSPISPKALPFCHPSLVEQISVLDENPHV